MAMTSANRLPVLSVYSSTMFSKGLNPPSKKTLRLALNGLDVTFSFTYVPSSNKKYSVTYSNKWHDNHANNALTAATL